ncbi:DUF2318 domain-containing protein [Pseudodesulfovibrio cashew]|uniref:DUF2318 domain-containing protein n=1 Tax=Pseudodesulfovibrio cashew TaxID=2678688 RepID=A0A6I6JH15_9BACT|nr:DUF2318 domain-containing protein [Pseudodesulfovibrio cashew]QGY39803.1 DUF2318 domain-containing protein [Pseudodesulfovibrio cashew]
MKSGFSIMLLALVMAATALSTDAHALFGFGKYASVESVQGVVSIPVSEVSDGEAHYYEFDQGGAEVKFFLLKSSDGQIRAAFDACDVCYREGKGYTQDGDFMVCNNCGQRFHSSRINEVRGGCNPSPLTRSFDHENVTIKVSDILAGRGYFQ